MTATAPVALSSPARASRLQIGRALLLLIILVVAGLLRVHDINRHSLWMDEFFSLETSSGHGLEHQRLTDAGLLDPAPDLISLHDAASWRAVATSLARDDNHPPLYFYLLRAWREIFGSGPVAIRALSVVISVAAVAVLYMAAAEINGPGIALWAALLMALAGPQIQYAQEARGYTLLLLLVVGAAAAVARLEKRGPGRCRFIVLGGCLLGMMLTHYYAIAPAAAIGLYIVIRFAPRARRRLLWTSFATIAIAAGLFALIWGWGLWRQRGNFAMNNWWIIEPAAGHLGKTFLRFALVPIRCLAEPLLHSEPIAAAGAILFILPPLLLRRRPGLLLWWLILLIGSAMVLAVDLADRSRQLEFFRYIIGASPGVYVLLPALLWDRKLLRHVAPAAGALFCILSLPQAYAKTQTPKPDWRVIATAIDTRAQAGDIAVFYGISEKDPGFTGSHYLALRYYSKRFPHAVAFISRAPGGALLARLHQATGVWTIIPRETPDIPPLAGFEHDGLPTTDFMLPIVQRLRPAG